MKREHRINVYPDLSLFQFYQDIQNTKNDKAQLLMNLLPKMVNLRLKRLRRKEMFNN